MLSDPGVGMSGWPRWIRTLPAPTGEGGVGVDRPDFRRIPSRIEQGRIPPIGVFAAVERGPSAPAAAPDNLTVQFDDEVGPTVDQWVSMPMIARLDRICSSRNPFCSAPCRSLD